MSKLKIVRALVDEGDTYARLDYDKGDARKYWHKIVEENPSPALEELAWFCDMEAESCNAHEFVQAHILLAGVLLKTLGRDAATKVMREIAERGGLDGMNGICGQSEEYDAFEEFGLKSGIDCGPDFIFKNCFDESFFPS